MLKPGETFAGRYRVEREIGRGGIGVVFACRHLHTQEEVAVKVLRGDLPEPELVRRKFRVEWGVWQRAPSEHIVRTLDAGIDRESGLLYSAMELLRGETLALRVRREGPLPPAEVVRILEQVSSGLDAAHQALDERGGREPIVHRDLKPNNLFLAARTDGATRVKILDFGSAKQLGDSTGVTQVLLGTPHYMASEQLRAEQVSPQTDIWALGLIAYYCLVGRNYWRAGSVAPDADPIALQTEILSTERVRPSQRWAEQGVSGSLPPEFDAWFLRCLRHDPNERFDSAGEAARALARALQHVELPLTAPPARASDVLRASNGREDAPGRTVPVAQVAAPAAVQAERATAASEGGDSASVAPLASEGRARSRHVQPSHGHTRWVVAGLVLVVVAQSWLLLRDRASMPATVEGEGRSPNAAVEASVAVDEPRPAPAEAPAHEQPSAGQPATFGSGAGPPSTPPSSVAPERARPEPESRTVRARPAREPAMQPPLDRDPAPDGTRGAEAQAEAEAEEAARAEVEAVTESAVAPDIAPAPDAPTLPLPPPAAAAPSAGSLYDEVGPTP